MTTENTKLGVEIDADVNGTADAKALADVVADISSALNDLVGAAKTAASGLDRVEKGAAGVVKQTGSASKGVQSLGQAYKDAGAEATAFARAQRDALDKEYFGTPKGATEFARGKAEQIASKAELSIRRQIVTEAKEARLEAERAAKISKDAADKALKNGPYQTGTYAGSAKEVAGRFQSSGFFAKQDAEMLKNLDFKKASADLHGYTDNLFTARFALHDVSNGLGVAGAALLAFNALTVKTAADYEQAFAQIQRTTGASAAQMEGIRDDFIALSQEIPVAFDELAKIGTLAGQLNIPTESLDNFTKITAMFASTTDVSVDAAATAFGRLDTLLPDVEGNYNALGSAILNVGVNSVATESEIISTTNQIAAAGAQAGFTSDQVIGLAASFASLGVAPEAARGTTIRVLSEIRTAVLEGGDALETFARLSGQSADQFQNSWNSNSSAAFMDVLNGLNKEGAMAEVTLRGLGITAVRDIRALLALSQNVEVVGNNMKYASDGFSQGTQLAASFEITARTLASRLQVLGQSLSGLVATLGQSGTGPLTDFVNMLNELVIAVTELSKQEWAQWLFVGAGLFTAIAGGAMLLVAVLARVGAAGIGVLTIRTELQNLLLATQAANVGLTGTAARMQALKVGALNAAIAATTLRGTLTAIASATVIGAGLTVLITAFDTVGNAMKSSGDKAKEAFGDFGPLAEALQKDTVAVSKGAEAFGEVSVAVERSSEKAASWVSGVEAATGGQVNLNDATTQTTSAVREQTYAIGENTAAVISNMLANDKSVQEAITKSNELNALLAAKGGPQLNVSGVLKQAIGGDAEGAKQQIADFRREVATLGGSMLATQVDATKLNSAIDLIDGALAGAASQVQVSTAVNEAFGLSATDAAADTETMANAADAAADRMQALSDAVSAAFANQNAVSTFAQDFYTLAEGIIAGGNSISAFSQAGQANLANLQSAIATSIAAGESMGISATESVGALFLNLQKMGVDTASLLAQLASIGLPGVNLGSVGAYLKGTKQMSTAGSSLNGVLDRMTQEAQSAAAALGGGGGGGGGGGSVADSAEEAAEEVRTLTDYARDLGEVFDRSFDLRFGNQQAIDKITSGWQTMAEASDKAAKAIRDARAELQQLTSDKAIEQYFLGVADKYGDNLRAGDIRGNIAEIDAKIADEKSNLTKAQEENNKSLEGNSKAAIDNRANILNMVGAYQDLIEQYAESGMSQEELGIKSEQLKQDFIKQATQAGYSKIEIDKYAQSFSDMTEIIKNVPRNITVNANISPAKTALAEFVARTRDAIAEAKRIAGGASGIRVGGIKFDYPDVSPLRYGLETQITAVTASLMAEYARLGGNSNLNTTRMENQLRELRAGLARLSGWKTGGYTGNGGTSDVAGVVHGKEYVINAQATQKLGIPFLNALNSGRAPTGGTGISVVELSAYDRQLLAAAGNVQLRIGTEVVARATNASNTLNAKRGSN